MRRERLVGLGIAHRAAAVGNRLDDTLERAKRLIGKVLTRPATGLRNATGSS
jgi:hypothetical protein